MRWTVKFTNQSFRQVMSLNEKVKLALQVLVEDLTVRGPAPGRHWSHYGKLSSKHVEDRRHCHLIRGRPTYVCCWRVKKSENLIEVYYVGTHEKAPY